MISDEEIGQAWTAHGLISSTSHSACSGIWGRPKTLSKRLSSRRLDSALASTTRAAG